MIEQPKAYSIKLLNKNGESMGFNKSYGTMMEAILFANHLQASINKDNAKALKAYEKSLKDFISGGYHIENERPMVTLYDSRDFKRIRSFWTMVDSKPPTNVTLTIGQGSPKEKEKSLKEQLEKWFENVAYVEVDEITNP